MWTISDTRFGYDYFPLGGVPRGEDVNLGPPIISEIITARKLKLK